ncbi:MAG: flippase-like domain-containing protein [Rhodospirillaceae bacterium]|nr:flippase-like domain-containing protein [Rhodospirillaceae bacterium]MBT6137270.1 flippase-like domain-containing protein [Rhodospirillaceae bacterium]
MNRKLYLLAKLLVSIGLLAILTRQIDGGAVLAAFARVPNGVLAEAFLVILAQFAVAAIRWLLLGRLTGASLSIWQTFRLFFAAMFFNQLLPTSLGGDAVRAWLASRQGLPIGRAANTVILDRSAGLISLLILMLVTGVLMADRMPNPAIADIVRYVPPVILLTAILSLIFANRVAGLIDRFIWCRPIASLLRDSSVLWRAGPISVAVLGLSLTLHMMTATCVWLLANGVGAIVGFPEIVGLLPPTILMMILPISIAGWGVREGVLVGLFALLGVAAAPALAISLMWGGLTLIAALLGGLIWVMTSAPEATPVEPNSG